MFLVFDVQVVEDLLLLCFSHVRTVMFTLKPSLPHFYICFLLLDKSDQTFIFIHQMGVLSQQNFDFLLQFIKLFQFPVEKQHFFIQPQHIRLKFFGSSSPIIFVGIWRFIVPGRASRMDDGLIRRLVVVSFLVVLDTTDWTVTHI